MVHSKKSKQQQVKNRTKVTGRNLSPIYKTQKSSSSSYDNDYDHRDDNDSRSSNNDNDHSDDNDDEQCDHRMTTIIVIIMTIIVEMIVTAIIVIMTTIIVMTMITISIRV